MKIFAIGAARNTGYYAASSLLQQGHSVTFFLRNTDIFDSDENIAPFVTSGKAQLIKGDMLVPADIETAWATANEGGIVDLILFCPGGVPALVLSKGYYILDPPDLCTRGLMNVFSVMPRDGSQPKLVVITAHGITQSGRKQLPLPARHVHKLFKRPYNDKLGMEQILDYCAGWLAWAEPPLPEDILAPGWEAKLGGRRGWYKSIAIIRPAYLTHGPEKRQYRVGEKVSGLYRISRKDLAHFIVNDVIPSWGKYEGKPVSIGY